MYLEGFVDVANALYNRVSISSMFQHARTLHIFWYKPKGNKGMDFLHMKKVCNISRSKTKTQQVTNHPHYFGIQDQLDTQEEPEIIDCFDTGNTLSLRTDGAV